VLGHLGRGRPANCRASGCSATSVGTSRPPRSGTSSQLRGERVLGHLDRDVQPTAERAGARPSRSGRPANCGARRRRGQQGGRVARTTSSPATRGHVGLDGEPVGVMSRRDMGRSLRSCLRRERDAAGVRGDRVLARSRDQRMGHAGPSGRATRREAKGDYRHPTAGTIGPRRGAKCLDRSDSDQDI
jgi:hypothetical protein